MEEASCCLIRFLFSNKSFLRNILIGNYYKNLPNPNFLMLASKPFLKDSLIKDKRISAHVLSIYMSGFEMLKVPLSFLLGSKEHNLFLKQVKTELA